MSVKSLTAVSRDKTGKNNCNRLRAEGFIPAVVYSHGKSEAIKIQEKEFLTLFKGHISESVIFDLHVSGEPDLMAYVKDFQKDPVSGSILHLDLFKVTKSEKIKTHVPIELVGTPAGIKLGGVLKQVERELMIQCLPGNLPEKITIDISAMLTGDTIHVSDIVHGSEFEILTTANNVVAAVERPKAVAEETESAEQPAAVEAAADSGKE
ncbi:MAG TPA: 50S ribosomal protein L25 [Spirochaetota bacterium]|nr:50S ribosomal protein L25 [Spirochaetota bacterium]HPS85112.1 50S ribosomal protein L25 [Spirochaetota bacterium]